MGSWIQAEWTGCSRLRGEEPRPRRVMLSGMLWRLREPLAMLQQAGVDADGAYAGQQVVFGPAGDGQGISDERYRQDWAQETYPYSF